MSVHVIIIIIIIRMISDVDFNVSDHYKIMNPSHTIIIITTKTELISRMIMYFTY